MGAQHLQSCQNKSVDTYKSVILQSGTSYGTAEGLDSSVLGGYNNTARGKDLSVSDGSDCTAEGQFSSMAGGHYNISRGMYPSVSGVPYGTAESIHSSVLSGIIILPEESDRLCQVDILILPNEITCRVGWVRQ